jgi:hypothetical protein
MVYLRWILDILVYLEEILSFEPEYTHILHSIFERTEFLADETMLSFIPRQQLRINQQMQQRLAPDFG